MPKFIVQLTAVANVKGVGIIEAETGEEAAKKAETSEMIIWSSPSNLQDANAFRVFSATDGTVVVEKKP